MQLARTLWIYRGMTAAFEMQIVDVLMYDGSGLK
jgi:hypothetical protein